MTFASKLVFLMERDGLTQADLAAAMRRAQSRIGKWVKEIGEPRRDDLLALSRIFGVSLTYLCDDALEVPGDAAEADRASMPEEYRMILSAVDMLGPQVALQRLMMAPPAPGHPKAVGFTELTPKPLPDTSQAKPAPKLPPPGAKK